MQNSIKLKPVIWKLAIAKFVPFYIGWAGAWLIDNISKNKVIDWNFLIITFVIGIIINIIMAFSIRQKYEIFLSEGKLTGLAVKAFGLNTETIKIEELDIVSLTHRTFFEKLSGYYSLKSIDGKKIMFSPFLYKKEMVKEFRDILLKQ